ncbi:SGNH/GDSL hydrolase family protein [Pantoea agglomerans]|uniref:SGNH/GDSL hydrolase family protein n=1 Tax=Enterobacter agglomerans TaxID=549 RepID=UPI00045C75E1|nr:SGNH/GDSL hydrolase family protein [Pantoea agglomerans]KDA92066.1 hypothetical protein T296_22960 [Pantoea agglomerans Eh318]
MSMVAKLTPHMLAYSEEFADDGKVNWLPYVMYFHPYNYRSPVVNTDISGFRYSVANGKKYAVRDCQQLKSCRLLAGSSTVFGIGASADCHTLSSRLSENQCDTTPWINFGGRSFNSTQEMILFSLNRHLLPRVEEVVLMSGFNDLGLARLPVRLRQDHGAFFMCNDYYDALDKAREGHFFNWFGRKKPAPVDNEIPSLNEQIDYATSLLRRNLANWNALCKDMQAPLTFVLQPLANWVRETGCANEEKLFAEREKHGGFAQHYGDILTQAAYATYRDNIAEICRDIGIAFIDLTPHIQRNLPDDFWLFVDRIHFTDQGHDLVARILLEQLNKSKR